LKEREVRETREWAKREGVVKARRRWEVRERFLRGGLVRVGGMEGSSWAVEREGGSVERWERIIERSSSGRVSRQVMEGAMIRVGKGRL